jgi:hypothetical protein
MSETVYTFRESILPIDFFEDETKKNKGLLRTGDHVLANMGSIRSAPRQLGETCHDTHCHLANRSPTCMRRVRNKTT